MKVLILAAGYGTRLERDLKADQSGQYEHLIGVPKPLLPIGCKALITRWMECLEKPNSFVHDVYVVTNSLHCEKFKQWACQWPRVQLIDDGTFTNESRVGAVQCIQLCIDEIVDTNDDLVIIGGDTLFFEDFKIQNVLQNFKDNKNLGVGAQVLCYKCKDDETSKFGILELNECNQVTSFLEKPSADKTDSRWACPCFYIICHKSFHLVNEFLMEKKDAPLQERDAPGNLIRYLHTRIPVFASEISGRFDVGGLQSYINCNNHFISKEKSPETDGAKG